jgi:hypothetical protein
MTLLQRSKRVLGDIDLGEAPVPTLTGEYDAFFISHPIWNYNNLSRLLLSSCFWLSH